MKAAATPLTAELIRAELLALGLVESRKRLDGKWFIYRPEDGLDGLRVEFGRLSKKPTRFYVDAKYLTFGSGPPEPAPAATPERVHSDCPTCSCGGSE